MDTTLARRRYRLGARLFTRTARSFLWWLVIGVPVTFAISIVFADTIEVGAWTVTASVFQWFVGITAGFAVHVLLPTQLAVGLTRREVTAALGVFGSLLSGAAVLLVAAGLFAEHALFATIAEPPQTLGETAAQAARYLVITPAYCSVGLALGAAEVRMRPGGLQAPLLLSAALVLAVVCMWLEFSSTRFPLWLATGAGLLVAMTAAFALFLRAAPVRPKRA